MPKPPIIASDRVRAVVIALLMICIFGLTLGGAYAFTRSRTRQLELGAERRFGDLSLRLPASWDSATATAADTPMLYHSWRVIDPHRANRCVAVHQYLQEFFQMDASAALFFWLGMPNGIGSEMAFDPTEPIAVTRRDGLTIASRQVVRPGIRNYEVREVAAVTRDGLHYWIVELVESANLDSAASVAGYNESRLFPMILASVEVIDRGPATQPATRPVRRGGARMTFEPATRDAQ